MIRIFLGNVGSGKTISVVRELVESNSDSNCLMTYSNIVTKQKGKFKLNNNITITRDMLIKKDLIRTMRDGTPIYKSKFNKDFWVEAKNKYKAFNVVIDEAHTVMNARKSMSKQNAVAGDFLALIRKVCNNPNTNATLTLISQLDNRIDVIAREMATEVRYHICMYEVRCNKCSVYWTEHSEMMDDDKPKKCPRCNHNGLTKYNHRLIVHYFENMKQYQDWKYTGINSIKKTKMVEGIAEYFPFYDTYQLDDLISDNN